MNKKTQELEEEIIGLKQLNEQLRLSISKKEMFFFNNYPSINNFEVKRGWHGNGGNATYKVIVDVFAEDLHRIVKYFTLHNMRDKKWTMVRQELKDQIKEEVIREYSQNNEKTKKE